MLFVPGFAAGPGSYCDLIEALQAQGVDVFTRPFAGLPSLVGRYSPIAEARDLVRDLDASASPAAAAPIWLAGHSRGGQVAWRTAELAPHHVAGLILIDPVDGAGPMQLPLATSQPATFDGPTLILGAELGDACAPEGLNHEAFAAACPAADHVVIAGCGHTDMCSGWTRWAGRRLCGGGTDPDVARAEVARLMLAAMAGALTP